jgi:hypothetical protein
MVSGVALKSRTAGGPPPVTVTITEALTCPPGPTAVRV